jgi:hypothetical protein
MEFKTLNDHKTFVLGQEPCKNKLIIPIKQVLKTKQTKTGTRLEKLKARLVARGDMKKRKINKARAAFQKQKQQQRQENAKTTLQEPARRQTLYQLRSLNLLKTHGYPVQLQEGSSSMLHVFVNKMLYVGSNDATKQKFKTSVSNCFNATFLGPAQRFLQMHSQ